MNPRLNKITSNENALIGYGSPQPIINKLIAKPTIDENL
jgi:hypothetical protein